MSGAQLVRFNDGDRWVCALVTVGHKHMHAVHIDDTGVRVTSAPKEELRHAVPLLRKGEPYPLDRFLKGLRRVAKARGITAAAENILNEVEA